MGNGPYGTYVGYFKWKIIIYYIRVIEEYPFWKCWIAINSNNFVLLLKVIGHYFRKYRYNKGYRIAHNFYYWLVQATTELKNTKIFSHKTL